MVNEARGALMGAPWCSSWKNPPLEKTLPFTGAQNLWLQISNSEGGAQKNGYYQDVP